MKPVFAWYIKDRVILHRAFGNQTLENVQNTNARLIDWVEKGKAPVHILVDARQVTKIPTNLLKMSRVITFINHKSVGWVIMISANSTISFVGGMVSQLSAMSRFRVVSDFDKAIALLRELDPTLDWSKAKDDLIAEQP